MQNKKQKYTSQNGNPHPWTETRNQKKEHKSRYGKTFPKKQNTRKNKSKMETKQRKQIRDTKQKQQHKNNM